MIVYQDLPTSMPRIVMKQVLQVLIAHSPIAKYRYGAAGCRLAQSADCAGLIRLQSQLTASSTAVLNTFSGIIGRSNSTLTCSGREIISISEFLGESAANSQPGT